MTGNHPKVGRRNGRGTPHCDEKLEESMTKIVLTFGLISGALIGAFFAVTMTLANKGSLGHSEVIGYTAMLLAFTLVFFGIRTYREQQGGGTITFGRAFKVGILIPLVTCSMYVIRMPTLNARPKVIVP